MRTRWRRRLDPPYPYRAERALGADAWLSAAVASYAAVWQLLVLSFVVLRVTSDAARPDRMGYILFDVDGRLIAAGGDQLRVWGTWAGRYGLDANEVYQVALNRHGFSAAAT